MGETRAEAAEVREKLESVKRDVAELARAVKTQAAEGLAQARERVIGGTTEWAKEHPAASIGIVAGVAASIGFVLGLMVGRNR